MMGVGGSVAAMLSCLRNNSKMLRKKSMFKKESGFLKGQKKFLKATKGRLEMRKATPEELKKTREVILRNRRAEKKNFIWAGLISVLIMTMIYQFAANFFTPDNLNPYRIRQKNDVFANQSVQMKSEYLFFLTEGDKYIAEKHWHNAIFQYSKALEIFPNEFDANYRLALAYCYSCNHSQKQCAEAKYLIEKIESEFPENQEIVALKLSIQKNKTK